MMDDKIVKIWELCEQLTSVIEDAVKDGYRVDVSLETYRMFGWRDNFTIVQASVYKGVTKNGSL